jgi:hypothetical protein
MALHEFKFIFWMEYAHRMWGRWESLPPPPPPPHRLLAAAGSLRPPAQGGGRDAGTGR